MGKEHTMEKRARDLTPGDIFLWKGLDPFCGLKMVVREVLPTRKSVRVKYACLGADERQKRECGFHHDEKIECIPREV